MTRFISFLMLFVSFCIFLLLFIWVFTGLRLDHGYFGGVSKMDMGKSGSDSAFITQQMVPEVWTPPYHLRGGVQQFWTQLKNHPSKSDPRWSQWTATKEPPGTSPYNKSGPNRRSAPQHIETKPWLAAVIFCPIDTDARPGKQTDIAIENGHLLKFIVDLPSYKMVDLSIVFFMYVYQRVFSGRNKPYSNIIGGSRCSVTTIPRHPRAQGAADSAWITITPWNIHEDWWTLIHFNIFNKYWWSFTYYYLLYRSYWFY